MYSTKAEEDIAERINDMRRQLVADLVDICDHPVEPLIIIGGMYALYMGFLEGDYPELLTEELKEGLEDLMSSYKDSNYGTRMIN